MKWLDLNLPSIKSRNVKKVIFKNFLRIPVNLNLPWSSTFERGGSRSLRPWSSQESWIRSHLSWKWKSAGLQALESICCSEASSEDPGRIWGSRQCRSAFQPHSSRNLKWKENKTAVKRKQNTAASGNHPPSPQTMQFHWRPSDYLRLRDNLVKPQGAFVSKLVILWNTGSQLQDRSQLLNRVGYRLFPVHVAADKFTPQVFQVWGIFMQDKNA